VNPPGFWHLLGLSGLDALSTLSGAGGWSSGALRVEAQEQTGGAAAALALCDAQASRTLSNNRLSPKIGGCHEEVEFTESQIVPNEGEDDVTCQPP
jgi:hypothetical protein